MQDYDVDDCYGHDRIGVHYESGKKCRSCGRTNCEGGAQCEIATEMRSD